MAISEREREFRENVWDHSKDAFHLGFDFRQQLTPTEAEAVGRIIESYRGNPRVDSLEQAIDREIDADRLVLVLLLQLAGLTRNKILQDLKAHARATGARLQLSSHSGLRNHPATWILARRYLAEKLAPVVKPLETAKPLGEVVEALNQATWGGFDRQERAKRSGHHAEGVMACLLRDARIPFEPEAKADNPLCPDATVAGVSFDIVIPSAARPLVCVKATVHTSNIGQYGESKDELEIQQAKQLLEKTFGNRRPALVAFVDGVGFESNVSGLRGVLEQADEFCQFRTVWKLLVIAARTLGLPCSIRLPARTRKDHLDFIRRWQADDLVKTINEGSTAEGTSPKGIQAGDAVLLLPD